MAKATTVWHAAQKLAFLRAMKDQIAKLAGDDLDAFQDTLEGAIDDKDVDEIMNTLVAEQHELKAVARARRDLAADYVAAAKRSEEYAEKLRGMIDEAMRIAQVRNWKGFAGSTFFVEGRDGVVITDETKVPLEFYRSEVDKSRVNDVAMDVHKRIQAIKNDASLTDAQRKQALADLKQLDGVEVRKGNDYIVIRGPSKSRKSDDG